LETEEGCKSERKTKEIVTDDFGNVGDWKIEPFSDKKVD
jgi:hypothetical protein